MRKHLWRGRRTWGNGECIRPKQICIQPERRRAQSRLHDVTKHSYDEGGGLKRRAAPVTCARPTTRPEPAAPPAGECRPDHQERPHSKLRRVRTIWSSVATSPAICEAAVRPRTETRRPRISSPANFSPSRAGSSQAARRRRHVRSVRLPRTASRAAVAAAVRFRIGHPLGMIQSRRPRVVTSRIRIVPSSVIRNGRAPYWRSIEPSALGIAGFAYVCRRQSMSARVDASPCNSSLLSSASKSA